MKIIKIALILFLILGFTFSSPVRTWGFMDDFSLGGMVSLNNGVLEYDGIFGRFVNTEDDNGVMFDLGVIRSFNGNWPEVFFGLSGWISWHSFQFYMGVDVSIKRVDLFEGVKSQGYPKLGVQLGGEVVSFFIQTRGNTYDQTEPFMEKQRTDYGVLINVED